jgi:tetratricopeptide (TPR) repeat protein
VAYYLSRKDYQKALRLCEEHLRDFPNKAPIYSLEAQVYLANKNLSKAEEMLQQTLSADPKFLPAYTMLVATMPNKTDWSRPWWNVTRLWKRSPRR